MRKMRGILAVAMIAASSLVSGGAMGDNEQFGFQDKPGDGGGGANGGTGTATPPAPVKKWVVLKKEFLGKPVGEKLEVDDVHAKTLVDSAIADYVADDQMTSIADGIFKSVSSKIQGLVDQAMEKVAKELKDSKFKGITLEVRDRANEDNDFGFETMGQFAKDVMRAGNKECPVISDGLKKIWTAQSGTTKDVNSPAAMNTQSLEDGGWAIPPTFSTTVFRKIFESTDVLGELDTYTLAGNSIVFPRLKEDSRATGSRYGGVRAYWAAEGNSVTGTKQGYDRLSLRLEKAMALVYVTQEQIDDGGPQLEQFMLNGISDEIRFMVGDSIFNGNSVGKPTGIFNHASRVTQAAEGSQSSATINANNISKMWSRVFLRSRQTGSWYINQECEPQLDLLALSIGTGGSTVPMYLMPGGLKDLPEGRLKGRPVKVIEFSQPLGTEGDICFFDPKAYCFITKGGIKTAMSMHLRFDYDEMVYKVTYRCNGAPWWPKALTPVRGTSTVSPVVTLAAR